MGSMAKLMSRECRSEVVQVTSWGGAVCRCEDVCCTSVSGLRSGQAAMDGQQQQQASEHPMRRVLWPAMRRLMQIGRAHV